MNGRRTPPGPGDSNPWVRRLPGEDPDEDLDTPQEPVVSPWNYPVDPPPGDSSATPPPSTPATPLLRRAAPEPPKRRGGFVRILVPVLAAIAVVAVAGVVLLNVLGKDEPSGGPSTSPSVVPSGSPTGSPSGSSSGSPSGTPTSGPPTPSSSSTYVPPANAIPVGYGVSVVPAPGWTVFTQETEGKELVPSGPNSRSTWFWVRQRQNIGAEDYAIRIFEGETKGGSQVRAGATQKNACPRDNLTECVSIGYSMLLPKDRSGLSMRCQVQTFRRGDGVVTALDFCSRPAFYDKANVDAKVMLKSVIDSQ